MIYRVLLVDDEMPALRYTQSIIEKYAPFFEVCGTCASSEKALEYLQDHAVDLLITDINMHGINGIELSKQVHDANPHIHIIIISGYAEFEYAQGAIQASVDEYILKPVSVSQMRTVLNRLKEKLDTEFTLQLSKILPALACNDNINQNDVDLLFGASKYRFALIRFGNLNLRLQDKLLSTSLTQPSYAECYTLRGRDDDEQILVFNEQSLEAFLTSISVYMSQRSSGGTWTVVYTSAIQTIGHLYTFINQSLLRLKAQVSIGRHQMLALGSPLPNNEQEQFTASELRQLSYLATSGKPSKQVKDHFLSVASDWEKTKLTQTQAWVMVRQMVRSLSATIPSLDARMDDTLNEIQDLFQYASSYGDLLMNIYSVLFNETAPQDRKMSTSELYDFAIHYIDEHYSEPLSMQSVSEEMGISKTYLSRLFRNYSDTTFNTYLTRRRMEVAMQLLNSRPNLLLRDVAAFVGYEDASYFSRVFHQYYGMTASVFTARK